eukprot:NODE_224_length_12322_cov_0.795549.p11 type:complete len:167 gc:universal NODE_224_length_12322_cov_0.795549:1567-1067(-)
MNYLDHLNLNELEIPCRKMSVRFILSNCKILLFKQRRLPFILRKMNVADTDTIKLRQKANKLAKSTNENPNDIYHELLQQNKQKEELKTIKINYEREHGGLNVHDKEFIQDIIDKESEKLKNEEMEMVKFRKLQKMERKRVENPRIEEERVVKKPKLVDYSSSDEN